MALASLALASCALHLPSDRFAQSQDVVLEYNTETLQITIRRLAKSSSRGLLAPRSYDSRGMQPYFVEFQNRSHRPLALNLRRTTAVGRDGSQYQVISRKAASRIAAPNLEWWVDFALFFGDARDDYIERGLDEMVIIPRRESVSGYIYLDFFPEDSQIERVDLFVTEYEVGFNRTISLWTE